MEESHEKSQDRQEKVNIPRICLGTAQLNDKNADRVISEAISIGYTHFDCAESYRVSPKVLGLSFNRIPRDKYWITWKSQSTDEATVDRLLKELVTPYIDLYLIHFADIKHIDKKLTELTNIQKSGKIKHIGVSNVYSMERLFQLKKNFNIVCNQIQALPPDVVAEGSRRVPKGFIEESNSLGISCMLFAPVSSLVNGNSGHQNIEELFDIIGKAVPYYTSKYVAGKTNCLVVGSASGSSLKTNYDAFIYYLDHPFNKEKFELEAKKFKFSIM